SFSSGKITEALVDAGAVQQNRAPGRLLMVDSNRSRQRVPTAELPMHAASPASNACRIPSGWVLYRRRGATPFSARPAVVGTHLVTTTTTASTSTTTTLASATLNSDSDEASRNEETGDSRETLALAMSLNQRDWVEQLLADCVFSYEDLSWVLDYVQLTTEPDLLELIERALRRLEGRKRKADGSPDDEPSATRSMTESDKSLRDDFFD
ncbi:MAG TPA: hypothetical protein PLV25_08220, partial [Opitutales bacterium]|nr:hypothetical protein [Opitutales bacterium]